MKYINSGLMVLTSFWMISCKGNSRQPIITESVITEGMKITVFTSNETITIEGKKGFNRIFYGDNWVKDSILVPRMTRWDGSLGLYDPGKSNSLGNRLVVDEGKQFFASESEALRYIQVLSAYYGKIAYTNNGLVVGYKATNIPNEKPSRSLVIWQFYINNAKPTSIRGANDESIKIIGGSTPNTATPAQAKVGYERELANKEYLSGE